MGQNLLSGKSLESFRATNVHKAGYGYGFVVRAMMDPEKSRALSSVGEFGWDGAAGAYCMVDTKNHLSIYLAQHVLCSPYVFSFHHAIRNFVYKCLND
jgi:CubicO group peptidase (beta-lactamase class C family)